MKIFVCLFLVTVFLCCVKQYECTEMNEPEENSNENFEQNRKSNNTNENIMQNRMRNNFNKNVKPRPRVFWGGIWDAITGVVGSLINPGDKDKKNKAQYNPKMQFFFL